MAPVLPWVGSGLEVEPPTTEAVGVSMTVAWIVALDLVMITGTDVVAFLGGSVVVAFEVVVGPEGGVVVELLGTIMNGG